MDTFEKVVAGAVGVGLKLELRRRLEAMDRDRPVAISFRPQQESSTSATRMLFVLIAPPASDVSIPIRGFLLPAGTQSLTFDGTAAGALVFFDAVWPLMVTRP